MIVKLSEIAEYSKGQQINGDELITNGEFDYLNGGINPSGKWNDSNVCGNTVTISEGGNSSGYVNYMEKPFWCGAHCYYLYNVKGNSKYLYYALKSQQDRIMGLRSGACMPNIKKSDLGKFELIYSFDDEEQTRITAVLDKVTDLIAKHKRQLELLDELVQARFVEMFGDRKAYNPSTINDVCLIITDGTHQTPKFTTNGIPFIFVSNISKNEISYNTDRYISEETYNQLIKRTPIEIGDILLSIVGSYGHPAMVKSNTRFLFQRHIAYLKPNHNIVDSIYLYGFFLSPLGQKQIEERVKGIAQKTLNLSEIKKIQLAIPPLKLQQQFADFVGQNDKSKAQVQKSLEQLETLKKALMQEYFG